MKNIFLLNISSASLCLKDILKPS